jgi:hypothetical protein
MTGLTYLAAPTRKPPEARPATTPVFVADTDDASAETRGWWGADSARVLQAGGTDTGDALTGLADGTGATTAPAAIATTRLAGAVRRAPLLFLVLLAPLLGRSVFAITPEGHDTEEAAGQAGKHAAARGGSAESANTLSEIVGNQADHPSRPTRAARVEAACQAARSPSSRVREQDSVATV